MGLNLRSVNERFGRWLTVEARTKRDAEHWAYDRYWLPTQCSGDLPPLDDRARSVCLDAMRWLRLAQRN
jgi:hypothetical protein